MLPWLDDLMSSQPERIHEALALDRHHIDQAGVAECLALVAWWQPDGDVADLAKLRLQTLLPEAEYQKHALALQWLTELHLLPVAGQPCPMEAYFEAFRTQAARYLPHIARYAPYTQTLLDGARRLYLLFGLEDQAVFCLEGLLLYNDQIAEAYYALGRIFLKRGSTGRAMAHLEHCLSLEAEHLYARLDLGGLEAERGNHHRAAYHFDKAIQTDPYLIEAYVGCARSHYALGHPERCRQLLQAALSINPRHAEALCLQAQLQDQVEDNPEAARLTLQLGLDDPLLGDNGLLLAALADLETERFGDHAKAKIFYQKSLTAQPHQPQTLRRYVRLLLDRLHLYDQAAQAYEDFLHLFPRHAAIRAEYAELLLERLGDSEQALRQAQIALLWEEDLPRAQDLLRRIDAWEPPTSDEDSEEDFAEGDASGDY